MSATVRQVGVRIGLQGAQEVTRGLQEIGTAGERSLAQITQSATAAGSALRVLGPILGGLGAGFGLGTLASAAISQVEQFATRLVADFLGVGQAAERARESSAAFMESLRDSDNRTRNVIREINDLLLTSAERATNAANAQRRALEATARTQLSETMGRSEALPAQLADLQRRAERAFTQLRTAEGEAESARRAGQPVPQDALIAARQAEDAARTERNNLLERMRADAARVTQLEESIRAAAGSVGTEQFGPNLPSRSGLAAAARAERVEERLDQRIAALRAATIGEREQAEAVEQGALAVQDAQVRQRAYTEALRFGTEGSAAFDAALARLTVAHRTLTTAQAEGRGATLAFTDSQTRADLALRQSLIGASAVERARATAEAARARELTAQGLDPNSDRGRSLVAAAADLAENRLSIERSEATFKEIGRIGEQAFDRIGSAITQMATEGRGGLRSLANVGKAVVAELSQAFIRLALLNPLKNMIGGGNAPTLGDFAGRLLGAFSGGGFGGISSTAGALAGSSFTSAGVPIIHTGGIVGATALPSRQVSMDLFRDARRYHRGGYIGSDEVPAILQKGEGVFTPEQMRALGSRGGGSTINVTFNGGDMGREVDRKSMVEQMRAVIRQEIDGRTPGIIQAAHGYSMGQVQRGGQAAREFGRR